MAAPKFVDSMRLRLVQFFAALAGTWLAYVALNAFWTWTLFSNLDRMEPVSLAEQGWLTRVGLGASHAQAADGPAAGQSLFLPGLLVVNQGARQVVRAWGEPDKGGRADALSLALNGASLRKAYDLLDAQFRDPPPPPPAVGDEGTMADVVATDIRMLHLRRWVGSAGVKDTFLTDAEEIAWEWFSQEPLLHPSSLALREHIKTANAAYDDLVARVKQAIPDRREPDDKAGRDAMYLEHPEAYRADLRRYYPLQRNGHLFRVPESLRTIASKNLIGEIKLPSGKIVTGEQIIKGPPTPGPNLTILYFPTPRGSSEAPAATPAPAPASPAPAPTAPPAAAKPVVEPTRPDGPGTKPYSPYCFALEISQVDGATSTLPPIPPPTGKAGDGAGPDATADWRVVARFYLFDLNRQDRPIRPTEQPTITLLRRGPRFAGFRPTAVETTEEQLAARFWAELEKMRKGAGINQSLSPGQDREAEYVRLVARLIVDRLGRPTAGDAARRAAYDPDRPLFEPLAEPMDAWVVWPRRLNGGTWWGAIQFLVVLLSATFLTEFVRLGLILRSAARLASTLGAAAPPWLPDDVAMPARALAGPPSANRAHDRDELRDAIESRMHMSRYLVTALPLVGFLGSVAGLSNSLVGSSAVSSPDATTRQSALQAMQIALGTAFDKSMIAFVASIACLFLLTLLSAKLDRISR